MKVVPVTAAVTPPQSTVAPPAPGGVLMRTVPFSSLTNRSLDWNEKEVFAPTRVMEVSAKVSSAIEAAAVLSFDFSKIFSLACAGVAPFPSPVSCSTMFFRAVISASFNSTAQSGAVPNSPQTNKRCRFFLSKYI